VLAIKFGLDARRISIRLGLINGDGMARAGIVLGLINLAVVILLTAYILYDLFR
jgi:hypothetical protein